MLTSPSQTFKVLKVFTPEKPAETPSRSKSNEASPAFQRSPNFRSTLKLEQALSEIAALKAQLAEKAKEGERQQEMLKKLRRLAEDNEGQVSLSTQPRLVVDATNQSQVNMSYQSISEFLKFSGIDIRQCANDASVDSGDSSEMSSAQQDLWVVAGSSLASCLTCSLCSHLMVDASVLPCSHGFCKACLEYKWRHNAELTASVNDSSSSSNKRPRNKRKLGISNVVGYCPVCNAVTTTSEGIG
jgi:hypothetical protein